MTKGGTLNAWLVFIAALTLCCDSPLIAGEMNIAFKASADLFGKHYVTSEGTGESDAAVGYSFSTEALFINSGKLIYGIGITYQIPREQKLPDEPGKKFSFFPIYGLIHIKLFPGMAMEPDLVIQGGYNFFNGNYYYRGESDLKGGLYLAAGFQISLHENFRIETMYQWHRGHAQSETSFTIDYRYISLGAVILL